MAWIKSHQELARHPKLKRLARALDILPAQAVGHLHMLWWWAVDYAQDGCLGDFRHEDIAEAAGWPGGAEPFLHALDDAGFLDLEDDGYHLHEWAEYMESGFRRRERDAARKREYRKSMKSAGSPRGLCEDSAKSRCGVAAESPRTGDINTNNINNISPENIININQLNTKGVNNNTETLTIKSNNDTTQITTDINKSTGNNDTEINKNKCHRAVEKGGAGGKNHGGDITLTHEQSLALIELTGMYEFADGYMPDPDAEAKFIADVYRDYPRVSVLREFRRAHDWLADAVPRRRPKKSLTRFLRNWLERADASMGAEVTFVPVGGVLSG